MIGSVVKLPGKELGDWLGTEEGRLVAIGDPVDVGEDVLVADDRDDFLESFTIGAAIKAVPVEVLNMSVPRQDFGEDTLLDVVSVCGDILNEFEFLPIILGNMGIG